MKYIYTACAGRCGQHTLAKYLNKYGINVLAEVEPPKLFYKEKWPASGFIRERERDWIKTNEMLGRGMAINWYERTNPSNDRELRLLVTKRIKRIPKKYDIYFELSKFFIRSYCEATYALNNDIGVLLLYRDPLMNAVSFLNRNKNYPLDAMFHDGDKTILLGMERHKLTKLQRYLWQWHETILRYQRFVKDFNIKNHYIFRTEDLSNVNKVKKLFAYFKIFHNSISWVEPQNTNPSQRKKATIIENIHVEQYKQFIKMIPENIQTYEIFNIKKYT